MRVSVWFRAKSFRHMDAVDHRIRQLAGKGPAGKGFCCSGASISLDYMFGFRDGKRGMDFRRRTRRILGVQAEVVT